jgi:hypothetical protein
MNVKERVDWLKAVGACLPGSETRPMAAAAAALDAAGPGRWETSVRGGTLTHVGLRFFGSGPFDAWRAAAAEAFSYDADLGPDAPRPGFPWLTAAWDLKTGAWTALRLSGALEDSKLKRGHALAWDFKPKGSGPERRALKPVPFKPGLFNEPALDSAFEDFSRLHPLSAMLIEEEGWSLRVARPLRWPLFARCDVSAAFTPSSSQLALFLLDRRVTELAFDGEGLWAHCAG